MAISKNERGQVIDTTNMRLGIIEVAKESERDMTAKKVNLEDRVKQLLNGENCMVIKANTTKEEIGR